MHVTQSLMRMVSTQQISGKLEKQQDMFTYVCISQQFVLVVEGYMGKEVDDLCYLHRQSVTTYVKKFNKGGMDALLERKCGLGRP